MTPGAVPPACSAVDCCRCSCRGACYQECEELEIAPLEAQEPSAKRPHRTTRAKIKIKLPPGSSFVFFPNLANTVAEVGKSRPYGSGWEAAQTAGDPGSALAAAAAAAAAAAGRALIRSWGRSSRSRPPLLPATAASRRGAELQPPPRRPPQESRAPEKSAGQRTCGPGDLGWATAPRSPRRERVAGTVERKLCMGPEGTQWTRSAQSQRQVLEDAPRAAT